MPNTLGVLTICIIVLFVILVILLLFYIYFYVRPSPRPAERFHTPFTTEIPAQVITNTYYKTNPYTGRILDDESTLFNEIHPSN